MANLESVACATLLTTEFAATTDAQARAYYACKFYQAVEENARINLAIAGVQQAASFYFADKQHDVAKQAQNRLDSAAASEQDKGNKMFYHWYDNGRPEELEQLKRAINRERAGYSVDYETAKNRVITDVRAEFGRAREKLLRERKIHCTGASRVALRELAIQESRAAISAVNSAYRTEESRKDLKESQYREELYKYLGLFRGVVGDSLNATKSATAAAAASSQINPYAGWLESFGGLTNIGNAYNAMQTADTFGGMSSIYGNLFHGVQNPNTRQQLVPVAYVSDGKSNWRTVPQSSIPGLWDNF